jgi:hypothetical protein
VVLPAFNTASHHSDLKISTQFNLKMPEFKCNKMQPNCAAFFWHENNKKNSALHKNHTKNHILANLVKAA